MSVDALRNLIFGKVSDVNYFVKSLLLLKSTSNSEQYLLEIHKRKFPDGDSKKTKKWSEYPNRPSGVTAIKNQHLTNPEFRTQQANILSFGMSRFIEFLMGYNQVEPDIQPVMLHYSVIYLFDFFSRTWLKYEQNNGHGMSFDSKSTKSTVTIASRNGLFQRAVDSFYLINQSSIFSLDDDEGIQYEENQNHQPISPRIGKMKYREKHKMELAELIALHENLKEIKGGVNPSNKILLGYTILFGLSSISRYRAQEWYDICKDRDLKNKIDLILYDFLYSWIPEILRLTVIQSGIGKLKSVPETPLETPGITVTDN